MTCGGGGLVGRGWRLLDGMVAAGGGEMRKRRRSLGYRYQRTVSVHRYECILVLCRVGHVGRCGSVWVGSVGASEQEAAT